MLKISLQFFAHKKGVGSTKNGRDSESKRLGAKALIDLRLVSVNANLLAIFAEAFKLYLAACKSE